jgi:hypothetical protein
MEPAKMAPRFSSWGVFPISLNPVGIIFIKVVILLGKEGEEVQPH